MAYYVRQDGNDSNDGSSATPWLTIHYGIDNVPDGETLLIGAGTYEESSPTLTGSLRVRRAFKALTNVLPECERLGSVRITGTEASYGANTNVNEGENIKFSHIEFGVKTTTNHSSIEFQRGTNIQFDDCSFEVPSDSSTYRYGVKFWPSAGYNLDLLSFEHCKIICPTKHANAYGFYSYLTNTATLESLIIDDLYAEVGSAALSLVGIATNAIVKNSHLVGGGLYGFIFGQDGQTETRESTGRITGNYIQSGTSHGCLLGCGVSDVLFMDNEVRGGDWGLVIKENSGTRVLRNTLYGGTQAALYFKAATNSVVRRNTIVGTRTATPAVLAGAGATGNKCSDIELTDNDVYATTGEIFNISGSAGVGTGLVVDRNRYHLGLGHAYGTIYGIEADSFADMQTAWESYSENDNDANSVHIEEDSRADVTLATSQPNYAPAKVSDVPTVEQIQDGLATSAGQTTILNRLGAWTGSGVNTILGAFKALLSKAASTPSDIGGTFDPATDSVEAVAEAIAAVPTAIDEYLAGDGARTVTITVNDGSDPLESAKVRMTKGGESYVGSTNVSGVRVFNLDDGTWTVAITLAGYTFTSTTLAVGDDVAQTYSMAAVTITPSDPGMVSAYSVTRNSAGVATAGITCYREFVANESGTGSVSDVTPLAAVSDGDGIVQWANCIPGATYYFYLSTTRKKKAITIPSDQETDYELPDFWGESDG